ncbi:MAG TPA: DNA repair protein RadA, partial [Candidatus Dojkabacteria bacterium]|nr:DNA repair protein RadA [Candidatus Dojkabacteria bacterium]
MKYVCSSCGSEFLKWSGRCSNCGQWGTLEEVDEEVSKENSKVSSSKSPYKSIIEYRKSTDSKKGAKNRLSTGFKELDRVLGGGLIEGEVVLVSGEPGVGKSTLLLQVALNLSVKKKILYVCGEESPSQLISRLDRLSVDGGKPENIFVTNDVIVENIYNLVSEEKFDLVIVDSIQSVTSITSKGYPGSISQVRASGSLLTRLSKVTGIPCVIVGQINKVGDIAGPMILEHIVDCVLYIEGGEFNQYRIIRGMKNRFGSTNEIGVFEMTSAGLNEVGNPSLVFLDTKSSVSGSAISAVVQGSRVVFVEVQALVVERGAEVGPLRRVANGIKKPRLDMLCAVLSRRGNVYLGDKDVFVNVVGGITVSDPAVDLAVCAAIKSVVRDEVLDKKYIYFGEVGLTGEIRGTWGLDSVMAEASRVGYKGIYVGNAKIKKSSMEIKVVENIRKL